MFVSSCFQGLNFKKLKHNDSDDDDHHFCVWRRSPSSVDRLIKWSNCHKFFLYTYFYPSFYPPFQNQLYLKDLKIVRREIFVSYAIRIYFYIIYFFHATHSDHHDSLCKICVSAASGVPLAMKLNERERDEGWKDQTEKERKRKAWKRRMKKSVWSNCFHPWGSRFSILEREEWRKGQTNKCSCWWRWLVWQAARNGSRQPSSCQHFWSSTLISLFLSTSFSLSLFLSPSLSLSLFVSWISSRRKKGGWKKW